ncbi:tubulin-tyrosine ligase family-domain-containing protein, partial [Baffinella frigidus]
MAAVSNKASPLLTIAHLRPGGLREEGAQGVAADGKDLEARAREAVRRVRALSSQASLNGASNAWIVKPAGKSRGRGIQVLTSLSQILAFTTDPAAHSTDRWIVQKYVEDPLLVDGHKFDIRQWVLVSDWNPVTVWLYQECYLRFALSKWSTDNFEDRLAHLCNNSVQKDDAGFEEKKDESMWEADTFRAWLQANGHASVWEEKIAPRMKAVSVWAMSCAQDVLSALWSATELAVNHQNIARRGVTAGGGDARGGPAEADDAGTERDVDLKEVEVDTGGWVLVHRGEVEVSMPVSLMGKLKVQGRSARIHRPGQKELYISLGLDGTRRKTAIKVVGFKKVFESRTEMLKEMNLMPPAPPPFSRPSAMRLVKRATSEGRGGEMPQVVDRMREWADAKARK